MKTPQLRTVLHFLPARKPHSQGKYLTITKISGDYQDSVPTIIVQKAIKLWHFVNDRSQTICLFDLIL